MRRAQANRVLILLINCIKEEGTEWKDIVAYISEHEQITNWLHVRGCLQVLRDHEIVARTPNIHKEVYVYTYPDGAAPPLEYWNEHIAFNHNLQVVDPCIPR